jgi:hypothetical protein
MLAFLRRRRRIDLMTIPRNSSRNSYNRTCHARELKPLLLIPRRSMVACKLYQQYFHAKNPKTSIASSLSLPSAVTRSPLREVIESTRG